MLGTQAARCRACASRTAHNLETETSRAVIDRPYSCTKYPGKLTASSADDLHSRCSSRFLCVRCSRVESQNLSRIGPGQCAQSSCGVDHICTRTGLRVERTLD